MTSRTELIGKVATAYLRACLSKEDQETGTARFMIDGLTPEQTAAIARCILDDMSLSNIIEIQLPAHFLIGQSLPDEILTNERATSLRNKRCEKQVLLIATTGSNEEQSLNEISRIGASELVSQPDIWVHIATQGLPITEEHALWWSKALQGLQEIRFYTLDQFAEYVVQTRAVIQEEGQTVIVALGYALPAIQLPRDSYYFDQKLNEKTRNWYSKWKEFYDRAKKKQACFLRKRNPSGIILNRDELHNAFDKVQDDIPQSHHSTIQAFIEAPYGWNDEAEALAQCEWEEISPLFDGLKREKFNLGQATIDFYSEREPDLLTKDEENYLKRLVPRKPKDPDDQDIQFYDDHRNELREDKKLRSAWERFIFGKPRETDDFIVGIALCLETLFGSDITNRNGILHIRCDQGRAEKRLRDLNVDAGLYFAFRYRGLRELLGKSVVWDVGDLFDFDKLVEKWKEEKKKKSSRKSLNDSTARDALQIKFELTIEPGVSAQLIWRFNPNTVASELRDDWLRLCKNPLVFCTVYRSSISSKGQIQAVDLADIKTLQPAYGRSRGSLVAPYKPEHNIANTWEDNLQQAQEQKLISPELAGKIRHIYKKFEEKYISALRGFTEVGLAHEDLMLQLTAYTGLLNMISRSTKGDTNRMLLLKPLLHIGLVSFADVQATAIVAPWHPLRLAAMVQKARTVANFLNNVLTSDEYEFGDTRFLFKNLREELTHPFYPEIVVGWSGDKPELLTLTDTVGDYTLHEAPLLNEYANDDTNENPTEGANQVLDVVKRYLHLHPHERANLSLVLYNCDSARLPQAVVEKLGTMHEDDDDVYCQVVLRHLETRRLNRLYEKINESAGLDADSFNASEITQDFMARLRISIEANQTPPPDPKEGCPHDLVFLQDVIARHAHLAWYPVNATPVSINTLVPSRWSRRMPAAKDDMKSVAYLCCPVQSKEGWAFLAAITTFFKGDWNGNKEEMLLPARQLDFQNPKTARIFQEIHNLGCWVINYDELLDRRQLLNQNVRVIRYKQSTTQGRNIIISSTAPLGLLKSMVKKRLKDLNLSMSDQEFEELAERFIDDANVISGDIVLRAAKRGRSASELMGIVLSRFLIRHEFGINKYYGWYFLDDYAEWLGEREQHIADILVLIPEQNSEGKRRLTIVISEAKYIDGANLATMQKESQKQLRDTVNRFHDVLFGSTERLDRELWLARLSDLLLDGIQFPASERLKLADWRRAVREGTCAIAIRGYSHVFVSGPGDAQDCSEVVEVAHTNNSYQEVFSRAQVRDLVLRYVNDHNPMHIREKAADESIWTSYQYRYPVHVKESAITPNIEPHTEQEPSSFHDDTLDSILENDEATDNQSIPSPKEQSIDGRWAYTLLSGVLKTAKDSDETAPDTEDWLKDIEHRSKSALQQFQLRSKLVHSILTPNAALLKFEGSANLTVEQILKRRSEFLTTHGLNIISIQPEPGMIALAIERPQRQVIEIQQVWRDWHLDSIEGNTHLPIGIREEDGSVLFLSPGTAHAPHTLIAGSTGSGKSVLMQNILLSIAATNTPDQARIILIDPKQGVDYFQFEDLPHVKDGVIDEQEQAREQLQKLVVEMDNRYKQFKQARTNSLQSYNRKVAPSERLPVIWLVHDEFAEWMLIEDYKQEVTATVARLGVKARAAGIYLVFAAQRPDAHVMPMQLRSNLGNRLILRVDSEGTSEIALGEKGAERLLGKGHLAAKLEGETRLIYAQVPFVPADVMDNIVEAISQEEKQRKEAIG